MASVTLQQIMKLIETLSDDEKAQLTEWLLMKQEDRDLSQFSFITSHTVLKKEWLNEEEDKAWENL